MDIELLPVTTASDRDRQLEPLPPRDHQRNISVWSVMRRWRAMLIIAAVVAGLAAYAVGVGGKPTYEAKAVLLVGPINTDLDTVKAAGQLAQTYAQLATTGPVLDATARRAGLRDVGHEVSASANDVTRLLTITVEDRDKPRAVRIAGAASAQLLELATQRNGPGQLQVVEPAAASSNPVGPGALPIALAAALIGFLGALGLAVVLDRSTGAVRDTSDITAATGAGCIGTLSARALRASPGSALTRREPRSRAADEFRRLAAKLRAVGDRSLCVLEVDERAVGVAANVAVALTAGDRRVAVVDAGEDDSHRIPKALGEGITVHHVRSDGRDADAAAKFVAELLAGHDVVVVRAPGLDRSPAGLAWARVADGTLLVAGTDRTSREDLATTVENLRLVHARVLGTVLGSGSRYLSRR